MAIVYTGQDKLIRDSIMFKIRKTPVFADNANVLTELGEYLGKPWKFQFPPRVTNDSKTAEWEEANRVSYEPIAYWMGAQARQLNVEATYVVTGEKDFSGAEIAKMAHAAKAYFYRSIEEAVQGGGFGPVVEITSLYGAVQEESTWRMSAVNVEYAPTFVNDSTPGKPGQVPSGPFAPLTGWYHKDSEVATSSLPSDNKGVWPLWTKIVFELKSWTQGANSEGKPKLKSAALKPNPTSRWF